MNIPFLELKTISECNEVNDPIGGWIPIDKGAGELEKISAEVFYQIIGTIAKPISPSDPSPTVVGWYKPQISSELDKPSDPNSTADWGTIYANAGNLRAKSGYDTLFYHDSNSWKRAESKMPQATQSIVPFATSTFPLASTPSSPTQRTYDNAIWQLTPGETATSTDTPGVSSKWVNLGSEVTQTFDSTVKKPQGGKQIYDFLLQNQKESETLETWANFSQNSISQNGISTSYSGYQSLVGLPALNIKKLIISLKTHINSVGVQTVYGKKIDGTFEQIYDSINQTLVDFEINISLNTYKYIYINMQSGTSTVKAVRQNAALKLFAPAETEKSVTKLNTALNYFIQDESSEFVTRNMEGGFTSNGNVTPLAGYAGIINLDASGIYKVELTADTRFSYHGIATMYGQKLDDSYETIFDMPDQSLVSYPISIPENTYKKLFFNFKSTSPASPVKIFKKININDSVLNYINSHSGGGGGINIPNTYVFAETAGVSESNTGVQNLTIINNLIDTHKTKGATIILPIGNIKIAGTIQLWASVSLVGALRGRDGEMSGGTILTATTSDVMINVQGNTDVTNNTAQTISDMQLNGANIATKGIYIGEGLAFFTVENMYIHRFTQVCIHTVGALIYIMRNLRVGTAPTGLWLQRTPAFQCNHIRFDMCQFYGITGVACILNGGGQVVFEQCDWEQNGTTGNANSGNMTIDGFSPLGEGIDVTLNNCWSEYINGGFWMKIGTSVGVTTIRDTMLWRLSGTAAKGVINNGAKLLITGSTKINDFPVDIETNSNGQSRVDGFAQINTHTENSGGTYKTATYS